MAIFLTENSKVVVQGMTGSEGTKHTTRMLRSGTSVVGGVNPKKAGDTVDFDGVSVPVLGSVADAMDKITAHKSGTISKLPISAGSSVATGDTLAVIS